MKKISILLMMVFVSGLAFLSSCSDDTDPTPPTISVVETAGSTYTIGSTVTYTITVSSNEKLQTLTAAPTTAGATGTTAAADLVVTQDYTQTFTYNYVIPASLAAASEVSIEFTVTDKETSASETKTFTVVASHNPISAFTAVLMGAQSNLTLGSYLATATGNVYTTATAPANSAAIDIIYYYGSANLATLCAPSDATVNGGAGNLTLATILTTKNATEFATSTVTAAEFDAMDNDAVIAALEGFGATKMTTLTEGTVFQFKTQAGKKGLIKVSTIATGADGSITINVKVQQ